MRRGCHQSTSSMLMLMEPLQHHCCKSIVGKRRHAQRVPGALEPSHSGVVSANERSQRIAGLSLTGYCAGSDP